MATEKKINVVMTSGYWQMMKFDGDDDENARLWNFVSTVWCAKCEPFIC